MARKVNVTETGVKIPVIFQEKQAGGVFSVNGKTGIVILTAEDLDTMTADEINDLIDSLSNEVSKKYQKPENGIPKTDLSQSIQDSLSNANTALQPNDVVNNTYSTDTDKPLSANMGKDIQAQVNNLKARGRFLSMWNSYTGLAESTPSVNPYEYKTGDYFIVAKIAAWQFDKQYVFGNTVEEWGEGVPAIFKCVVETSTLGQFLSSEWEIITNKYRPSGTSYDKDTPSSVREYSDVSAGDVYYYDGTTWMLQKNTQGEVGFANIVGDAIDNLSLAGYFNGKVDNLTFQNFIDDVTGYYLPKKQDKPTIKSALDNTLTDNTIYRLGYASSVNINLPATADGIITVIWYNGATTITPSFPADALKPDYTPKANTRVEVNAMYDGVKWALAIQEWDVTQ